MLWKEVMEHARLPDFLLFKGSVSYEALIGTITEYVRKCYSFVSNFALKKNCPATSKEASDTMCKDIKRIEARLDNKMDALSEQFQNVILIL